MKTLSHMQQALIFIPILAISLFTLYFYYATADTQRHNEVDLPIIQGVVLQEPKRLAEIELMDHHGKLVNRDYFIGKWHVIAYGYTHCPDICPTTLFTLSQFADLLKVNEHAIDTQFVFYTVDPQRDTQEILAEYIHYFSKEFVAVRANSLITAAVFQQSLGINVEINGESTGDYLNRAGQYEKTSKINEQYYQVNHGLAILLINPKVELQAVFLPEVTKHGVTLFTSDSLYQDYLKVIKYYQQLL